MTVPLKPLNETAVTDVGIKLYNGAPEATTGLEQLVSVISTPAMGSEPAQLEYTPLDAPTKMNLPDRVEIPVLSFGFNFTVETATALQAINGTRQKFVLKYQDGHGYVFVGTLSYFANAVSRASITEGTFTIVAESLVYATTSEVTALTGA